jgi:uncharacterized protein YuzE
MRLTWDPRHNIAYLSFRSKNEQVETVQVSEDVNVDIAPDGGVFGIELLNANEQLRGGDGGAFIIINDELGQRQEIPLG